MPRYIVTDANFQGGKEYLIHRFDKVQKTWHKRWHWVASFNDLPTAVSVTRDLNRSLA